MAAQKRQNQRRDEVDEIEDPDADPVPRSSHPSVMKQAHLRTASPGQGAGSAKKNRPGSFLKGAKAATPTTLDFTILASSTRSKSTSTSPYTSHAESKKVEKEQRKAREIADKNTVVIPQVAPLPKPQQTYSKKGSTISSYSNGATVAQLKQFKHDPMPTLPPERRSTRSGTPSPRDLKKKQEQEESSDVGVERASSKRSSQMGITGDQRASPFQVGSTPRHEKISIPIDDDVEVTSSPLPAGNKKRARAEPRSEVKELEDFQTSKVITRSHPGLRRAEPVKAPVAPKVVEEEPQPPAKKPRIAKKETQLIDLTEEKPSQALSLDSAPDPESLAFDPSAPTIGFLGFQFGSKAQEARSQLISMTVNDEQVGFKYLDGNSAKNKDFDWSDVASVAALEDGTHRSILAINFKHDGQNVERMRQEDPSLISITRNEDIPQPHFLAVAAYREAFKKMWNVLPAFAPKEMKFQSDLPKEEVDLKLAGELLPMLDASVSVEKILHERQMTTRSQQKAKSERKEPALVTYPKSGADAVTIFQSDIDRLTPDELLNDSLIDFYLRFLYAQLDETKKREFLFFNSYFFKSIHSQTIRKWTKKVNIFEHRFIALPVNQAFHWKLAVICNPASETDCCIVILDSLGSSGGGQVYRELRQYLADEYRAKHEGKERTFDATTCPGYFVSVPIQHNGIDCGVYMLKNLENFVTFPPSLFSKDALNSQFKENWYESNDILEKRKELFGILETLSHEQGSLDLLKRPVFDAEPEEEIEVLNPKPTPKSKSNPPAKDTGEGEKSDDYIKELLDDTTTANRKPSGSLGDSQQRPRRSLRTRKSDPELPPAPAPAPEPESAPEIVVDVGNSEDDISAAVVEPILDLQMPEPDSDKAEDHSSSNSKRKRSQESGEPPLRSSDSNKRPRKKPKADDVSEELIDNSRELRSSRGSGH